MNRTEHLADIFDKLAKWRHLPDYQLERRADIFFAVHLIDILLAHGLIANERIFIIPEFPIRKGTIEGTKSNQSKKADYAVFSEGKCFLIELKTDFEPMPERESIRYTEQLKYYQKTIEKGFPIILDGVKTIRDRSRGISKKKYDCLIQLLNKNGIDMSAPTNCKIEFYESPILIKPSSAKIDGIEVIGFSMIAEYLASSKSNLTKLFVQALKDWNSAAGKC